MRLTNNACTTCTRTVTFLITQRQHHLSDQYSVKGKSQGISNKNMEANIFLSFSPRGATITKIKTAVHLNITLSLVFIFIWRTPEFWDKLHYILAKGEIYFGSGTCFSHFNHSQTPKTGCIKNDKGGKKGSMINWQCQNGTEMVMGD